VDKPDDRPDFSEGLKLVVLLGQDLGELSKLRGKVDEAFFRRLTFRNFFSLLDAFIANLKARALEAEKYGKVTFSEKTKIVLEEGYWQTAEGGERQWVTQRPRTKDNIRIGLGAYAEARGCGTPLQQFAPLPPRFDTCLEVRNRITHPKRLAHMQIASDELAALVSVIEWFQKIRQWAAEQEQAYIQKIRNSVKQSVDSFWENVNAGKPRGGQGAR